MIVMTSLLSKYSKIQLKSFQCVAESLTLPTIYLASYLKVDRCCATIKEHM